MKKSYIGRQRFAVRRCVYGALFILAAALSPAAVPAVDVRNEILIPAQGYVGAAYCHGGLSASCFDCSGFVSHLYRPHVPGLPRLSNDMARFGTPVERGALRPGDLVFFVTGSRAGVVTHVAVYIGNDSIIHAISDGPNRGVSITPLSARYWRTRYHSARRVVEAAPATRRDRTDRSIRFADGAYTGELRDGVPHGEGRMVLNNGDEYTGSFADGAFHGQGVYRWAAGERY
ncbi:MAG: NlpC/P60 family protein, partial [Spirochaetales bacterium]|nr:NlpC/P60 family protein [Spirochaetales bacterium]